MKAQSYLKNTNGGINFLNMAEMGFRNLVIVLLSWVLTGCCEQADLVLTPALKSWLPGTVNPVINFQNQAGQSINLRATTKTYRQESSDKMCGSYFVEVQEIKYTTDTEPVIQFQITISHGVLLSIKATGNTNMQFNVVSEQIVSDPYRDLYLKSVTINKKVYANVLHVFGDAWVANNAVTDIYYARGIGLSGFKIANSDWYFLP